MKLTDYREFLVFNCLTPGHEGTSGTTGGMSESH